MRYEGHIFMAGLLRYFEEAFGDGQFERADQMASKALLDARRVGDIGGEGLATWLQTRLHVARVDYPAAVQSGLQALHLFERNNDRVGCVKAQIVLGFCASKGLQNNQALGYAFSARALADAGLEPELTLAARTYAGIVLSATGRDDAADQAFESAIALARGQCSSSLADMHALLNRAAAEAFRQIQALILSNRTPAPARLQTYVDELAQRPAAGRMPLFTIASGEAFSAIVQTLTFLIAGWSGQMTYADTLALYCVSTAEQRLATRSWLLPFVLIARQQVAYADRNYPLALHVGSLAIAAAECAHDKQCIWMARGVQCRALEQMGEYSQAADHWRRLWLQDGSRSPSAIANPQQSDAYEVATEAKPISRAEQVVQRWRQEAGITLSESAIALLIARGSSAIDIANMRGTTEGTVRFQIKSIQNKTGHHSLLKLAVALGGEQCQSKANKSGKKLPNPTDPE
jgi:DNA-binding CsgD family transcriptional regulator